MSTNTNKRIAVKHIRDGAKAAYDKQKECFICGSEENLELHHVTSLTLLLENWAKTNNIDISTDAAVLAIRDRFIDEHRTELYDEVFTLCLKHHQKLHSIFGKAPLLHTSSKQVNWVSKQKAKALGLVTDSAKGSFSAFY